MPRTRCALKGRLVAFLALFAMACGVPSEVPRAEAASPAFARSQARSRNESWRDSAARYSRSLGEKGAARASSVFEQIGPLVQLDISSIPKLTDAEVRQAFLWLRDSRFLRMGEDDPFLRRESWLYPDDGCQARAAIGTRRLVELHLPLPKKFFILGDLEAETHNSPEGKVWWWYHVALIYRVGSDLESTKVIDPSLESREPLSLLRWVRLQSSDLAAVELAICESGTYEPGDSCLAPDPEDSADADSDEAFFLALEWSRQLELGRDPFLVLGDQPPWLLHENATDFSAR